MITIIFGAHGTTFDNENHLSSGHFDVELSPLGEQQAKQLGENTKIKNLMPSFVLIYKDRIRQQR